MIPFYKYHVESGTVASKIVVPTIDHLSLHAQAGYDFAPADPASTAAMWVDSANRAAFALTAITLPASAYEGAAGEEITISGLPKPCWVQFEADEPQKVTTGSVSFIKDTPDTGWFRVVGRYNCAPVLLSWIDLEPLRAQMKERVDQLAEEARARLITIGSGMAMTYLRKADAARMFLDGTTISDAQRQRLLDEATRLNVSIEDAANVIVTNADAWEKTDAEIDNIRLSAKSAITAAKNGTAINAIMSALVWPI